MGLGQLLANFPLTAQWEHLCHQPSRAEPSVTWPSLAGSRRLIQAISAGQEPGKSWGGQDLLPGVENNDQGSSTEGTAFPSALPAVAFCCLASRQALVVLLQYLVC